MLAKTTALIAATVALFATTTDAKVGFGACPEVNFMTKIDMDAYSGKWYTVKRDDARNPMYMARCDYKEFKNLGNGKGLLHAGSYQGEETGYKDFNATLVECGEHDNSTCMVTNPKWKEKKYPFTLLATDYENYDVYYFCYPFAYNTMNFQMVIIGSRTPGMPEGEKLNEVNQVIKDQLPSYDLNTYDSYSPDLHEDWCKYDFIYEDTQ